MIRITDILVEKPAIQDVPDVKPQPEFNGDIEFPFTRKQIVEAGLGHHSVGAASTDSGGISARSILSPGEPGLPACTGSKGIATRLAFFHGCFFLAPARTKLTSGILLSASCR